MSYGVNQSSLSKLFLLQNFMNINGTTLIFLSPPFSAGPQDLFLILKLRVIYVIIFFLKIEIFWGHEVIKLYFSGQKIHFLEILGH